MIFYKLIFLFQGVVGALYINGSSLNETSYEAFQNDLSYVNVTEEPSHSTSSAFYITTKDVVTTSNPARDIRPTTTANPTSELGPATTANPASEFRPSTLANTAADFKLSSTVNPDLGGHLVFIDRLLQNYDKRAWPTFGSNRPTIVTVNIYINSLGSVSAANMDFGMDIYLRQSWVDPRLRSSRFGVNSTVTLNGEDIIDKIWKPDLFFRNLKSGHFHIVTVPNKLIKLSPNGKILFSMRLTLRLSCHMSFRLYPLDAQRCWVVLGSYAQTTDQVIVKWRRQSPITIEKEIEVPEFHVVPQEPTEFFRDIDTGVFSFLNVSFVFLRQNGYHLVQTYLPTFLIVMMSWVSFWVPVEAAPARVTLGVTTLLSLTTVASGIRSQLPPVSYAKAIDIWIGACSVMVFAALLEFALASYLSRMKIRHEKSSWNIFSKHRRESENCDGKNRNVIHTPESDKKLQMRRSHTVDRFSRIGFPFVFLVFNMFYWIYYLTERAKMEQKLL